MGQERFERYCASTTTDQGCTASKEQISGSSFTRLREWFGTANVYGKPARSILNPASGYIRAYDFTLNPYRGCQYGCSYCYATAFSPNQAMRDDWGNWVIVKENAAELIAKDLDRWQTKHDRPPSIYMSTVTDPYQPIECRERLTRSLLEVMLGRPRAQQPTLVVQTRSPMVVRDLDLLHQFDRVRINLSIPTGSDAVRRDFEPRSPSIKARLNTLAKIRYTAPFDSRLRLSATVTPFLPTFGSLAGDRDREALARLDHADPDCDPDCDRDRDRDRNHPDQRDQTNIQIARKSHKKRDEKRDDLDQLARSLACADRVVFQPFHRNNGGSLGATTRAAAIELRAKYADWYAREADYSQCLRDKLRHYAPDLEILDGAEGFGYA
jgi:DNA repair photolyase